MSLDILARYRLQKVRDSSRFINAPHRASVSRVYWFRKVDRVFWQFPLDED